MTTSGIFHFMNPSKVGPEVLALNGKPGMRGWAAFVNQIFIVHETDDGEWDPQWNKLSVRLSEIAPAIKSAGFVMLDWELGLDDYKNTPLYIEIADFVAAQLGRDIARGFDRIPDHKRSQRFTQNPVLTAVTGIFIMAKQANHRYREYFNHVMQVAPNVPHILYLDAINRNTNQPYPKSHTTDIIKMARDEMTDLQFAFRQKGPHVAQHMLWAAEELGWEVTDG